MNFVVNCVDDMVSLSRCDKGFREVVIFVFKSGVWYLLHLPGYERAEFSSESLPQFIETLIEWGWGDVTISTFLELVSLVLHVEQVHGCKEA